MFDVTMIATGLGGVVLLEHILNAVSHSKIKENKEALLHNEAVRNALAKVAAELQQQKETGQTTGKETQHIIQDYILATGAVDQQSVKPKVTTETQNIIKEKQNNSINPLKFKR